MWTLPHGANQTWDTACTSGEPAVRARRESRYACAAGAAIAVGFQAGRDPDEMAVVEARIGVAEPFEAADQEAGDDQQETTHCYLGRQEDRAGAAGAGHQAGEAEGRRQPKDQRRQERDAESDGDHSPIREDGGGRIVLQLNHTSGRRY